MPNNLGNQKLFLSKEKKRYRAVYHQVLTIAQNVFKIGTYFIILVLVAARRTTPLADCCFSKVNLLITFRFFSGQFGGHWIV